MKNKIIALCLLALPAVAWGQPAIDSVREYMDINNIQAAVLTHGDLWYNPRIGTGRLSIS